MLGSSLVVVGPAPDRAEEDLRRVAVVDVRKADDRPDLGPAPVEEDQDGRTDGDRFASAGSPRQSFQLRADRRRLEQRRPRLQTFQRCFETTGPEAVRQDRTR